ncbi:MAG: HPF/RaiA family ribosome-associated protein [Hyphomicrobiaceae bacterium]|nr:ribosome-associated translation inhibitor RaiA [Hyphomicrobiaceae bacterium]
MTIPLEIHFHGLEKSDAVENRIREKFAKLERHFDRMSHCRVVVEAPHRSPQKPKVFQVKIEISVPGRQALVITQEREGTKANEDLSLAIRDAFEAAQRHVDAMAEKLSSRVKSERGRRRPKPDTQADL